MFNHTVVYFFHMCQVHDNMFSAVVMGIVALSSALTMSSCLSSNGRIHLFVCVALVPLAALLCVVVLQFSHMLVSYCQLGALQLNINFLRQFLFAIRPTSVVGGVTLLDVLCFHFFLLTSYCVALLIRRAVTVVRLLKFSCRRLAHQRESKM